MSTGNIYVSLNAEQKNNIILEKIEDIESKRSEIDSSMTKEYISLLSDLSFVIESIQKGLGNRQKNPEENPGEVLKELREAFGYEYVAERITSLSDIAEYEHQTDSLVKLLTDMTAGLFQENDKTN